jgi:hypothetical protein
LVNLIKTVMERGKKKDGHAAIVGTRDPGHEMEMPSVALPQRDEIPWLTALGILEVAHPYFREKRGTGFGQLIMKYQSGECKITRMEASLGAAISYRVQVLGSGVTIMEKDVRQL